MNRRAATALALLLSALPIGAQADPFVDAVGDAFVANLPAGWHATAGAWRYFDTAACFNCFMRASRIAMSSCISLAYSPLPANQRESQVRLMPSRRPIGLTF